MWRSTFALLIPVDQVSDSVCVQKVFKFLFIAPCPVVHSEAPIEGMTVSYGHDEKNNKRVSITSLINVHDSNVTYFPNYS